VLCCSRDCGRRLRTRGPRTTDKGAAFKGSWNGDRDGSLRCRGRRPRMQGIWRGDKKMRGTVTVDPSSAVMTRPPAVAATVENLALIPC
jgi:hypothetical protein